MLDIWEQGPPLACIRALAVNACTVLLKYLKRALLLLVQDLTGHFHS
jgi:hypothetical protein